MDILASTRLSVLKAEINTMELENANRVSGMDAKFIVIGKTGPLEPWTSLEDSPRLAYSVMN
jgi:hypothetical protein